jgi:hypothetical protein
MQLVGDDAGAGCLFVACISFFGLLVVGVGGSSMAMHSRSCSGSKYRVLN